MKPVKRIFGAKFFLCAAYVLAVFILSSCGGAINLKDGSNGYLIDGANGRSYIDCSVSLIASSVSSEVYAKSGGLKLYEITNANPAEWLSEDITSGIPLIFREVNAVPDEPVISDFSDVIYITQTEVATIQTGIIDDKEIISGIIQELLTNEEANIPPADGIDYSYRLNFASEKYPGIYYTVQFIADKSGKYYLHDRGQKRCVIISSEVPLPLR